ncbi:hypothetical protein VTI74DRAFT_7011 [Chaetomium olivicolor]
MSRWHERNSRKRLGKTHFHMRNLQGLVTQFGSTSRSNLVRNLETAAQPQHSSTTLLISTAARGSGPRTHRLVLFENKRYRENSQYMQIVEKQSTSFAVCCQSNPVSVRARDVFLLAPPHAGEPLQLFHFFRRELNLRRPLPPLHQRLDCAYALLVSLFGKLTATSFVFIISRSNYHRP